jgi:RNA polymerase sigma factor (TIGR02999 family)
MFMNARTIEVLHEDSEASTISGPRQSCDNFPFVDESSRRRVPPGAPAGKLVADVYAELRRIADTYVRRERAQSVQATELVHEAYLRLAKDRARPWRNRTHFVAIAAISMRRLLVERARARAAAKRGGARVQVTLDEKLLVGGGEGSTVDLVALDRALDGLADLDPQQARVVELRFFGGLSVEETADALSISPATVKRDWTVAKAWLLRAIQGATP